MNRKFPTREQTREEDERVQTGVMALVYGFGRIDTDNVEAITGKPHREEDGLEDDLAVFFEVGPNGIINAVNRLREAGEVSCTSQKGGPAHDPRHVISRIALSTECRVQ